MSSSSSSDSCTRGIRLQRYGQTRVAASGTVGYRFQVVATDACDLDNEIFVYLRHPYNPGTGAQADSFTAIASPMDLAELPIGGPTVGQTPALFRLATLDLVVQSEARADAIWAEIKRQVAVLIAALNSQDALVLTEDVTIGGPLA